MTSPFTKRSVQPPSSESLKPDPEKASGQPPSVEETTLNVGGGSPPPLPRPLRTKHRNLLGANSIALYIAELDDPLVVQVTQQMTLGRSSGATEVQPTIDLTPYDAFALGVSRIHAAIRRDNDDLLLEDLGSANGSKVNSDLIVPHTTRVLHSGDVISLGRLTVEVYFLAGERQNDPAA